MPPGWKPPTLPKPRASSNVNTAKVGNSRNFLSGFSNGSVGSFRDRLKSPLRTELFRLPYLIPISVRFVSGRCLYLACAYGISLHKESWNEEMEIVFPHGIVLCRAAVHLSRRNHQREHQQLRVRSPFADHRSGRHRHMDK